MAQPTEKAIVKWKHRQILEKQTHESRNKMSKYNISGCAKGDCDTV